MEVYIIDGEAVAPVTILLSIMAPLCVVLAEL